MTFERNLPLWERGVRIIGGAAMMAVGGLVIGDKMIGYSIAMAGVMVLMTGLVGFCPACALAGRCPIPRRAPRA
jgi:hypothetical protein